MIAPLDAATLPAGIRARLIPGINGLTMHVLEAGTPGQPLVLLLHGFPELAYSWRKVMPALAAAGYHVVAPDRLRWRLPAQGHPRIPGYRVFARSRFAGQLADHRGCHQPGPARPGGGGGGRA